MPQSLAQIWLHLVFSTKDRRPWLKEPSFRNEMFQMLAHHVKETQCLCASVGGYIDHVHLLVALSRTLTVAKLIERVKTETSKWAKKASQGNSSFCWQVGYGAFSVSHLICDLVVSYIQNQDRPGPSDRAMKTTGPSARGGWQVTRVATSMWFDDSLRQDAV